MKNRLGRRSFGRAAAVATATAILPRTTAAQGFPNRPFKFIVAFGAGSATDITARTVAQEFTTRTGQPVVIENRPGAEGQIAAQAAAGAAPDGYTLFVTTQTTQAANIHIYKSLAYDPVKSFVPVSGLSRGAQVVMVRNDLPARSIAELVALAKAQPGKLTFASGNGSSRAGGELFKIMAKVDMVNVPYRAQPQAVADLMGGRIDVVFSDFFVGLPPVKDGRARGIAVTSRERTPGLEEFPTVHETLPGFEMWAWTATYAPAGTPGPVVARLSQLVREATQSEAYRTLTRTTHGIVFSGTSEELAAFQASEMRKWGEIVAAAGMREP
ncbi:MAG: tripartite tricarboxylate transporter substrate binding protein [Alphaproteobacteria bacterium]|nr:tripartite tricarboxylate transporter substrate binding protein [Alphaproteobacteria bacterium]